LKIAVVGAGAMGSLFGCLLKEAGEDVTLVDVWKEHVEAVNKRGLRVYGVSGEHVVRVKATTNHSEVGHVDLLILFVKAYDTERAIRDSMPMIAEETVILTCQNGLGNVEKIGGLVSLKHVIAGSTMQGATMVKPGEVFHAGRGPTYIGELNGEVSPRVKNVVRVLNDAGIEAKVSRNINGVIWGKTIINAGLNAFGALTRMRNGELLLVPELVEMMSQCVREGVEVAKALRVKLEMEDPVKTLIDVCKATAENKNSMLQDIEKGRRTEVEAINGAIVRYGEKVGVPTPINSLLTALIKGLETSITGRTRV